MRWMVVIVDLFVMASRRVHVVLVAALLGHAFCVPVEVFRLKRGYGDNELDSTEVAVKGIQDLTQASSDKRPTRQDPEIFVGDDSKEDEPSKVSFDSATDKVEYATPVYDSDEDDDDFEPMNTAPAGGGSNIFSLLRLASALFPGSSGGNRFVRNLMHAYFNNQFQLYPNTPINPFNPGFLRRNDVSENLVDVDEIQGLKPPPLQRQETEEDDNDESESVESDETESDENDAAEESVETNNNGNGNNNDASQAKSASQENGKQSEEDDFSDEPPEGDGQGGGFLGILAGLSGGEDGQSDLGSLLATISGIVASLSGGEGFDLNAVISSGIGLFVGLLSEGEENPGAVIASYLLTSLDTITGGGSKNNGAFFGTFLSKLIKGTSAQAKTPDDQPASPIWTLKMDILRAFLQFGTSLLGKASSSSSSASG